jgi:hypothetical protein
VRRYDVSIAPGAALATDEEPLPGKVPGPYRAETYPVTADGQYLVVEIVT